MTNKVLVFGLLKRNGRVYTRLIKNASKSEFIPIIRDKVDKSSTVYTDKWGGYNSLVYDGFNHKRINNGKLFVDEEDKTNHINGIENFWGWVKNRLRKFNGIKRSHFHLHLKECEFRFNHRNEDLYQKLLEILRQPNGS